MRRFLTRRLAQGAVVIYAVVTVVFLVTRVLGDPAKAQLPPTATAAQRAAFNTSFGYDRPILTQYVEYIGNALRGDFGVSSLSGRSAMTIVLEHLPNTLLLIGLGTSFALVVGVVAGGLAAARPGGFFDRIVTLLGLIGISTPPFWAGILLAMVFGAYLGILPVAGTGGIRYVLLPALTVAMPIAGRIMVMVRSSMLEELGQPYVLAAQSRGASKRDLIFRHALKNAMIPIVGLVGWEFAVGVAGYATSVEVVFNWSGIGLLALNSLKNLDFEVVQAVVVVVAVFVVLINLLVDICYMVLDPKINQSGAMTNA